MALSAITGILGFVFVLQSAIASDKPNAANCLQALTEENFSRPPLVQIDPGTYAYRGLTPAGVVAITKAQETLLERDVLFAQKFRNLQSAGHAWETTRLFGGNMFFSGPPGAAKSAFVKWFFAGEKADTLFQILVHQMLSEQAFIGGQDFEAAKKGKYEINIEGSLADRTLALIDELDKISPAVASTLLNILNEREVMVGGRVIEAKTSSVYSTSNANLAEIFAQFVESGQRTTAPALLNRFQIKAFAYNWLDVKDQAELDARRTQERYLSALGYSHPQVMKAPIFDKPNPVDWEQLKALAYTIFVPSPLFEAACREFVNEMRKQTHQAIRESEERHSQNPSREPFVYFPSAEYTERLRQQLTDIVIASAFLDFVRSPMATEENLAKSTGKRIELDPVSLWRAYLVLTTVGPGKTHLTIDKSSKTEGMKLDIEFGAMPDPTNARDKREEIIINQVIDEQKRFRSVLTRIWGDIRANIELAARNSAPGHRLKSEADSFEIQILKGNAKP